VGGAFALGWILAALGCVLPGVVLVARQPWTAAERLAAGAGLSLVALGVISGATYLAGLPLWTNLALPLVALAAAWPRRRALRRLWVDAREGLLAFALLTAALLALLALIRVYGGGDWWGDWLGHYERARLFADRAPPGTTIFVDDVMPSRPPLANLAVAALLGGGGYPVYQLSCVWIAATAFFGVWLAAERAGAGARSPWWAAALMVASPVYVQGALYPWTKAATAALAVCGALFLERASRDGDRRRLLVACVCLGAAPIAHYSALPFAMIGAAWLLFAARLPLAARASAAASLFAPLAAWLAWASATFGRAAALGSSTTARAMEGASAEWLVTRVGENLLSTLVPHVARDVDRAILEQPSTLGWIRDVVFLCLQTNAVLALGLLGLPVLVASARRRRPSRRSVVFFGGLAALTLAVNVAAHPWPSPYGVAHIGGLPLVLLGLGWLAAVASRSRAWARWLAIGAAVDVTLGIALHVGLAATPIDPGGARLGRLVHDNARIAVEQGVKLLGEALGPAHVWLAPVAAGAALAIFARAFGARLDARRGALGAAAVFGVAGLVFLQLEVPAVAGPDYFRWPWTSVAAARFWPLWGLAVGTPLFFAAWQRARRGRLAVGWLCVAAGAASLLPHLLRGGDLRVMVALLESETVHGYATSAAALCDSRTLWSRWPATLPAQPMHVSTHPPGLVALWCGARAATVAPAALMAALLTVAAAASPWAVHGLGRALAPRSAFLAATFAALSPTIAAFAPSFDAAYVPLACLFLWAVHRSPDARWAIALTGVLAFALSQLAYTLVLLGLPAAVLLGAGPTTKPTWSHAWRHAWRPALGAAAVAVGCHVVFSLITDFDPLATLEVALANQAEHLELLADRRLPRTLGWDLADWALAGAFTLPWLALRAPLRLRLLALLPPVVVAVCGVTPGETFRLWSIFLPGLWIAAAAGLRDASPRARAALLALTLVVSATIGRQLAFVWL